MPDSDTDNNMAAPTARPTPSRFEDALEGAELLLDFAARNGFEHEKLDEKEFSELSLAISETKRAYETNELTADARAHFYEVYWHLAQLMRPVSVNSIRDSYASFGTEHRRFWLFGGRRKYSQAETTVRYWRLKALIALWALLIIQIYWVTGYTLIEGIRALDKPANQATATANSAPADLVAQKVREIREEVRQDTLFKLLGGWWNWIPFSAPLPQDVAVRNNDGAAPPLSSQQQGDDTAESAQYEALLERCTHVVNILQVYILPLLYGLLGAHAYVLRELIRENRERTYRSESETAYRMRILLGLLAGLAIGWFARPAPGSEGFVANLTPFALSFLAGYSVEVLFSAMDRFVAAFGSISQQAKS